MNVRLLNFPTPALLASLVLYASAAVCKITIMIYIGK